MNSTILLTATEPALKLSRPSAEKWAAALAEERRRLLEDQEQLREREENLRRYEARLRSLQEEIEAGRGGGPAGRSGGTAASGVRVMSRAPFGDEAALMAGWEKLHRARELLEAEQAHLREDRLAIRDQEQQVKKREAAVTAREQALAARESQIEAIAVADAPVASEHTLSAVTRLTRVPFDMARSVFGGKK
jgi:DNA repair exonuclease SbcCD ATPase subunit